jgi:hypothetical protein
MKRQKWTIGSIVKIPLKSEKFGYGQLLDKNSIAIFKIRTERELEISEIVEKEILFIVAIYNDIISSGRWQKIAKVELKSEFEKLPFEFIQDELEPNNFELYNPNTGEITKANKNQCIGLERAAVWEHEHVQSRIDDYFDGIKNIWVEQLKLI